ncbi:hypothetical protein RIF29_29840 [Crotalaria pallida]|uniref:Carbohydrate kinase FGGY C-terminal domain-containing protein n=1 Tax=Crotalaria pallida TaxID=3830 RepID=A0AAN9EHL4_CROPI
MKWLTDSVGLISTSLEIQDLASKVESTDGVYIVPSFDGLFAPWWHEDTCGVQIRISRFTKKARIARATLESIAYQPLPLLDYHRSLKEDYIFDSKVKMKNATVFKPVLAEEVKKKKVNSWCKVVTRTFDLIDLAF